MDKIIVIGSCGAGKSTLSKKLSKKHNLPLINLDKIYWRKNWQKTPKEEWRNKVSDLVKQPKWIMDGNYQSTFDIRFPACDTVVFLDFNRFICLWRTVKRRIFQNRVDKIYDCKEKLDFEFIKWILFDYPERGRKNILNYIKKFNGQLVILKTNKDISNFLNK